MLKMGISFKQENWLALREKYSLITPGRADPLTNVNRLLPNSANRLLEIRGLLVSFAVSDIMLTEFSMLDMKALLVTNKLSVGTLGSEPW